MQAIMPPRVAAGCRQFWGDDPRLPGDPLLDPQHCLRTYYAEGAAEVFRGARGRLM